MLLLVKQMSRISLTQSTKVCNLSPLFEPRDVKNILLTFFFWSVLLVMEPRFFPLGLKAQALSARASNPSEKKSRFYFKLFKFV